MNVALVQMPTVSNTEVIDTPDGSYVCFKTNCSYSCISRSARVASLPKR